MLSSLSIVLMNISLNDNYVIFEANSKNRIISFVDYVSVAYYLIHDIP